MKELNLHISKQMALVALGLSFVWPYFYWTFFLVSSFGQGSLCAFNGPEVVFLAAVALFGVAFAVWGRRVVARLAKVPPAAPIACLVSAGATIALHVASVGALALPAPLLYVLAVLAALGLPLLLALWSRALYFLREQGVRTFLLVLMASLLIFFVYALLFLTIVVPRCLLALGSIASALVWAMLCRESEPDAAVEAPIELAPCFSARRQVLPVLAYVLVSIVYWLFFVTEEAGSVPSSSFALFGVSPLTQGSSVFYALFLGALLLVLFMLLLTSERRLSDVVSASQVAVVALVALYLLPVGYFVPAYVDLSEGLCCLVRACLQYYLLSVAIVRARAGSLGEMFAVLFVDVATIALASGLVVSGVAAPELLFANLGNVSFAFGMILVALLAVVSVRSGFSAAPSCDGFDEGEEPDRQTSLRDRCSAVRESYSLSAREEEVLFYLAQGFSARKIAEELVISSSTVQTHIARTYAKLGVHTKQELIDFMSEQ